MNQISAKFYTLFDAAVAATPAFLLIIVGAIVLKFLFDRGFGLVAKRTTLSTRDLAPARKALNWLLFAVTAFLLLGVIGFNLGGLWTMLSTVLAMIAIGFVAVWSVLSNVSCTVIILIARPFAVGDEIEFAGESVKGRVVDLNFLFTTLEAEDHTLVQIPNNLFFQRVLKRRRGASRVTLSEQLQQKDETK